MSVRKVIIIRRGDQKGSRILSGKEHTHVGARAAEVVAATGVLAAVADAGTARALFEGAAGLLRVWLARRGS